MTRDESKLLLASNSLILLISLLLYYNTGQIDVIVSFITIVVLTSFTSTFIRKYLNRDISSIVIINILSAVGISLFYSIDYSFYSKTIVYLIIANLVFIPVALLSSSTSFSYLSNVRFLIILFALFIITPLFGIEINGSRNWIDLGFTTVQISEFLKVVIIVYLSATSYRYKDRSDYKSVLMNIFTVCIYLIILVYQKDLGTSLIVYIILSIHLYAVIGKIYILLISIVITLPVFFIAVNNFSHFYDRLKVIANPFLYRDSIGFQASEGLFTLSSANLFGTGLGNGLSHMLPIRESDYIFAVVVEEYGILFAIGIITLLVLLCLGLVVRSHTSKSKLVSLGLSSMILSQSLVILLGVYCIVPLTGINLPFISYGGSSLISMYLGVAVSTGLDNNNKHLEE
ncbi:MAG: FtsW/RodA/SpoVE family cell cycle protein [Anaeroplasmataceae bacterium]